MPHATSDVARLLAGFFHEPPSPGVVSASVFGSYAVDRVHSESDVDLGVLLDWAVHSTRAGRFEQRLRLSGQLAGVLGTNDVDVVILNDAPPCLARAILATGRLVFCRDPEAHHAFLRTTLLRAADLDPFLRRVRRVKLAALAR